MKRMIPLVLSLVLAVSLLCPAAQAAQTPSITLSEQYTLFAGGQNSQSQYEESYWAAPVVTDLDNDGALEVISAAYTLTVADAATGRVK